MNRVQLQAQLRWIATLVFALAACGPAGDPPAGPGLPGGPTPPSAGRPFGQPMAKIIDSSGGTVALTGSTGDSVTLTVPAGAVATPTDFTITEISPNTAYGAVGAAYRLAPAGTLSTPVTLTFTPPPGDPVDQLTAAFQDPVGYWYRVYSVSRDTTGGTLSVNTTFLGDWSLVSIATQRDLHGPFRLDNTEGDAPFTALGDTVLQFIGEDDMFVSYVPTGSLTIQSPLAKGAATCTAVAPATLPMPASVAEIKKVNVPPTFRWGINGQWNLTCDDGTAPFVSTNFDSLGITNPGCTRAYNGASIVDPAHLQGQYVIDCGAAGRSIGAWDLVPPDQTPGTLPSP